MYQSVFITVKQVTKYWKSWGLHSIHSKHSQQLSQPKSRGAASSGDSHQCDIYDFGKRKCWMWWLPFWQQMIIKRWTEKYSGSQTMI